MKTLDISATRKPFLDFPSPARRDWRHKSFYNRFGKRLFDLVLAIVLLPVLAPVIATLWLLVRRDGGAGFFGHRRVGRGGKVFKCWKIRTMVMDAEPRLIAYLAQNPEAAAEWASEHKLRNDPRITKIGGFLRATSLDELPQIWNVLRGEMSFVGPRPVVRGELVRYGRKRSAYLAFRPGLTGIWQVSGRNDVSYETRVQMDVEYCKVVSLKEDVALLLKTGKAVIDQTGR